MTDVHSKEVRSYNMSRIRNKNTKPEQVVRKYLHKKGFRYLKNYTKLPGCPDIVLKKYRTCIFINGCFWHKHEGCKYFGWPKSNTEFWYKKIEENVERDRLNYQQLKDLGWKVILVWECELRNGLLETTLERVENIIRENCGNVNSKL
ncbi:very short patch repair endonuclease [Candidatus Darwinibacter acetoxidans]